jgi:hypothetical protein
VTKIKKIVLAIVIIAPVSWVGFTIYAMTTFDIETLMTYATSDDNCRIPYCNKPVEYYTLHFRGTKEDVAKLEQGIGLSYVFSDSKKRSTFLNFLLDKGVNINKVSPLDGTTPLHAAVLQNDPELVKFLLDHGADPTIRKAKDNSSFTEFDNMTPLEMLEKMVQNRPELAARSKVKQVLLISP